LNFFPPKLTIGRSRSSDYTRKWRGVLAQSPAVYNFWVPKSKTETPAQF
jgi:hypothetical protein